MARKIAKKMSLASMESEVMFTNAALKADPNASSLASSTESWLGLIDEVSALGRVVRQAEADADASRVVGNSYLDSAARKFGDDLLKAVGKNTKSSRWVQFFPETVSALIKTALPRQVALIKSWLTSSDVVLQTYHAEFQNWTSKCDQALFDTDAVTMKRGDYWQKREQLAAGLTRDRDALHRTLAQLGDQLGMPRGWADQFFRVESRSADDVADDGISSEEPTEKPATSAP